MPKTLFYGDNLQVLRDHIPEPSSWRSGAGAKEFGRMR